MGSLLNFIPVILELGLRLTIFSTGQTFDPYYQERTDPFTDIIQLEKECNFTYSSEEWTQTFLANEACERAV